MGEGEEGKREKEDMEIMQSKKEGIVVKVNPKPKKGWLTSTIIDCFEKLIVKFMYDNSQPLHYLSGNFAPVSHETPPATNLPVLGHLPECLNGEFVRVGPNPKFAPVAGYHWFDGDGMIHGMHIKDGKATYVSRYVQTSRLKQEEFFGGPKFMKIGDLKGFFGLLTVNLQFLRAELKVLDMSYGNGTANTALIYHHGKLLALSEGDKPWENDVAKNSRREKFGRQLVSHTIAYALRRVPILLLPHKATTLNYRSWGGSQGLSFEVGLLMD